MASPDFFGGILGGFMGRQREVEDQTYKESLAAKQREGKVFEALMASDDPEVRHLALTGLIDSARPQKRAKGLRGYLGELEASPTFGQIQGLISGPDFQPRTQQTLPSKQTAGPSVPLQPSQPAMLDRSNSDAPAAMPDTSLVQQQGQQAPPTPTQLPAGPDDSGDADFVAQAVEAQNAQISGMQQLPQLSAEFARANTPQVRTGGQDPLIDPRTPNGGPLIPGGNPSFSPPQSLSLPPLRTVFMDPMDRMRQELAIKTAADVEGERMRVEAGLPPRYGSRLLAAGRPTATIWQEGNVIPDPGSPTGFSQTLYRRDDPAQTQTIPAMDPQRGGQAGGGGRSPWYGQDLEAVAQAYDGKPFADHTTDEKAMLTAKVRENAVTQAGATTTARGQANADVPLTTQQRYTATNGLQDDWRKVETPHREMERQFMLMQTGLQRFRAGDRNGGSQAVITTFQKMLDPTSVVRESEYARSPEGLGLLNRLQGSFERAASGGAGVPEADLAALVETGRQFLDGMKSWNTLERRRIETTATSFGIDPALITGAPTSGPPPPPRAAQPARPPVTTGGAAPPPAAGPANLFVGADGQLHTGSPTGPLYTPGR